MVCTLLGVLTGLPAAIADADQSTGVATVPRPDHVVMVLEENRAATIVGSPEAPFISTLAAQNANFTQSFAETHPSQPNYLALYSGSTQGVTDDSCPHTFTSANLGDQLTASGAGFATYSEDLPSVGFTGCTSAKYVRKHNPAVNWPSVPATANRAFNAFPTDYSTLPAVSFVVPNLVHDMHDGTIAQGDAWLQNNLSGYIAWAKTHNSLFILSFDEDDNNGQNRIPTIMAGSRVIAGTYAEHIDHYSILRTIQDAYGLAPIGASSAAEPILDVWTLPPGAVAPAAAFTSTCVGLACTFNGGGSTDPDGTIVGYRWDFGDGTTTTGITPSHTFPDSAVYPVGLTVTDDTGVTATLNQPVTVTGGQSAAFASDSFNRTTPAGFGPADVGGTWAIGGSTANLAVTPGAATLKLARSSQNSAYLTTATRTDADVLVTTKIDKVTTGSGAYLWVSGRRVSAGNEYTAKARFTSTGTIGLVVSKFVGGTESVLAGETIVPGLTYAPGTPVSVRVQVTGTGPTTIRARAWATGSAQPTAWLLTTTDATASLQNPGGVGLIDYLSGGATNAPITLTLNSFSARSTTAPVNQLPIAAFTTTCSLLACSFDASGARDPDGTIADFSWSFGDATAATGVTTNHTYPTSGTYDITLTVTDNSGASNSIVHSVAVVATPPNQPPTATFTSTCTLLSCTFDASASRDPDGTIVDYAWTFVDTDNANGITTTYAFGSDGTYSVTLILTDDIGATTSTTQSVTVSSAPPNRPPVAVFTATCTLLSCSFDGSGSTDPDGSIARYSWSFGDSTTSSGGTVTHTYAAAGTYQVALVVTDNQGTTAGVTHSATPTAPANPAFASDTFNRTVSGGLGQADTGGAWTTSGNAANISVSPGAAAFRLTAAGSLLTGYLPSVLRPNADVTAVMTVDKVVTGNGLYATITGRRLSPNNEYRARLRFTSTGQIALLLTRMVGGTETALGSEVTVTGLTYATGIAISIRVQVSGSGPTTVRARAWRSTGAEPAAWTATSSDATAALQGAGAVGVSGYVSGSATNAPVTLRITAFSAKPVG
ncbi:MAG: domain containing protein [Pseudonocardiales bacterium]|nr:domain containing protein [Pseudonocardiales bacterium]